LSLHIRRYRKRPTTTTTDKRLHLVKRFSSFFQHTHMAEQQQRRTHLLLPLLIVFTVFILWAESATTPPPGGPDTHDGGGNEASSSQPQPPQPQPEGGGRRSSRPNFVYVMTDDQDLLLGSMNFMPRTQQLLGDQGTQLSHFYVTTSLCCPSRTTLFRGQYCHNHKVFDNTDNGGFRVFRQSGIENSTLATWLRDAGYTTALMGKFLNGYQPPNATYIPPGWTDWFALTEHNIGRYYNSCYSVQGQFMCFTGEYQTDTIRDKAVHFLKQRAADSSPFFLLLTPHAPHSPSTPPQRYANLFADLKAPRTPSFNASSSFMELKPSWIKNLPPLNETMIDRIDGKFRNRSRCLLALDDMVAALVNELNDYGLLDNTYFIFTSDNGWHFGQHRMQFGKRQAYEEDVRVPFFIRGPGIPQNRIIEKTVINVDLAPTIAELAGLPNKELPDFVDGVSFASLLLDNTNHCADGSCGTSRSSRRSSGSNNNSSYVVELDDDPLHEIFLIEGNFTSDGAYRIEKWNNIYQAIRFRNKEHDYLYVEWAEGDRELYNNAADPHQMHNIFSQPGDPTLLLFLQTNLQKLRTCSGKSCRDLVGRVT
jgi:N-acetylglucosamine-6-sulfatase